MSRHLVILSTIALCGALATPAHARFSLSKGRTRAIRTGIAKHINANPVAHVNWSINRGRVTRTIKPSEVRIRSNRVPSFMSGMSADRAVKWQLKSGGMLQGTARASTPIVAKRQPPTPKKLSNSSEKGSDPFLLVLVFGA